MDFIYSWVKNIVFFLVLITIINNLVGDSSYKKYVNLISGMILMILVISPFLNLFDINENIDYYFSKNTFTNNTENINNELISMEETKMQLIIDEYKKEIESTTKQLLEKQGLYISKFHVDINENFDDESFGEIEQMDLVASYTENFESEIAEKVEKVEIEKIEIDDERETSEENQENIDSNLSNSEIYLKNLLSDFYNIKLKNINISIEI